MKKSFAACLFAASLMLPDTCCGFDQDGWEQIDDPHQIREGLTIFLKEHYPLIYKDHPSLKVLQDKECGSCVKAGIEQSLDAVNQYFKKVCSDDPCPPLERLCKWGAKEPMQFEGLMVANLHLDSDAYMYCFGAGLCPHPTILERQLDIKKLDPETDGPFEFVKYVKESQFDLKLQSVMESGEEGSVFSSLDFFPDHEPHWGCPFHRVKRFFASIGHWFARLFRGSQENHHSIPSKNEIVGNPDGEHPLNCFQDGDGEEWRKHHHSVQHDYEHHVCPCCLIRTEKAIMKHVLRWVAHTCETTSCEKVKAMCEWASHHKDFAIGYIAGKVEPWKYAYGYCSAGRHLFGPHPHPHPNPRPHPHRGHDDLIYN